MTTDKIRDVLSNYEDKLDSLNNKVIEFIYTLMENGESFWIDRADNTILYTCGGVVVTAEMIDCQDGDILITGNMRTVSIHCLTPESLIRLGNLIIEHKENTIRKQYMGYSHKFKLLNHDKELFAKASAIFKEALQFLPEKNKDICDTDNKDCEPTITADAISFNGSTQECEWFNIYPDKENLDYCKTARLPYDAAVCLCLIVFFKLYGRKGFQFDTDGHLNNDGTEDWEQTTEGWAIAKKAYNKYCRSKKIPVPNYSMWVLGIKDE